LTRVGPVSNDSSIADSMSFWEGDGHEVYDEYHGQLLRRFPSFSDAESARLESNAMTVFDDGLYALYERLGTTERFVGAAVAWQQDNEWHYVAQLNGEIQIRGKATVSDQILHSQWGQVGMNNNGAFQALTGQAFLGVDGVITISGRSDAAVTQYQSAAYRVGTL